MVVALFRENRQAFVGDNMNRLKSGAILRVSTAEQANGVAANEASREIRAQAADWNAYRNKLAGQVAASPTQGDGTSQTAAGKIGKATTDHPAAPSAALKDVLKLSKNADGKGEAGKAPSPQERINALQEESTARQNQINEEKVRVSELEKNIQEMQKLLALKNQGMAEMQNKAAGSKGEPPASAAPPTKAAEPTKPAMESKPVPEPKPAPAVVPPQAEKAAQPVAQAPADVAKPAETKPTPPVKKPIAVQNPPEASFLDDLMENPLYQAGAAAIIALLGFFGYRAYKKRNTDTMPSTGATSAMASDLKSGIMGGGQASGVVDTGNSSFLTDFEKTGPGVIDVEEVDPVAEAEVYIAYGRDAQAEEILKEAMAKDSGRHEIPLKLLEIYAARKSVTSFEATARDLHASIGTDHPLWNRVADMGRKLDPTNVLYATGVAAAAAVPAVAATSEPEALETLRIPGSDGPTTEELISHGETLDFDLHAASLSASTPHAGIDLPPAGEHLPIDLSLDTSHVRSPTKNDSSVDFELGGLNLTIPKEQRPEPPAAEQTLLARPRQVAAMTGGDLNLSDLQSGVMTHENVRSQGSVATTSNSELKLPTLSLESDRPIIPAAVDTVSRRPGGTMDLGGLNLDLPAETASLNSSAGDGNSEWHSIATKLDLARAYLEIGDKDGAREILQEVIQDGDSVQKREAESITASMV